MRLRERTLFNELYLALESLVEGEECDHAVNICWCGYKQTLADAAALLKTMGGIKR